jgi:hypothetical protein
MSQTYTTEDFIRTLHGTEVVACSTGASTYTSASSREAQGADQALCNVLTTFRENGN